jgi:hypothetical protein
MNPVGESFMPNGRGRGFSRHEQGHRELRRPQAEKRTGMDTDMKRKVNVRYFVRKLVYWLVWNKSASYNYVLPTFECE